MLTIQLIVRSSYNAYVMTTRRACCSSGRRACLCYRTAYVSYPACSTSALTPTQPTVRGCPNPNLACGLLCYRTAYGKHVSHYSTGCIRSRRVVHVKHISPKKNWLHLCKLETCTYISLAAIYGLTAMTKILVAG